MLLVFEEKIKKDISVEDNFIKKRTQVEDKVREIREMIKLYVIVYEEVNVIISV